MNQEQKEAHIRKLNKALKINAIAIWVFLAMLIASESNLLPWLVIPSWFLIGYWVVMTAGSLVIMALNCCPWCGASFLWEENLPNQIVRILPLGRSVKHCANCGMPSDKKINH